MIHALTILGNKSIPFASDLCCLSTKQMNLHVQQIMAVDKAWIGPDRIGLTKSGSDRTGLTKPGSARILLKKPISTH